MTEPSRPRPVPGPPAEPAGAAERTPATFTDLHQRPVPEHVDVFEAEHARLERELRTIDQL